MEGSMMAAKKPECAKCHVKDRACLSRKGQGPDFCPTLHRQETLDKISKKYAKKDIREFARQASIQEAESYAHRNVKPYILNPSKPRVQETCEFAQKMGYKKLGVAFCSGLKREAQVLTRILEAQEFEVVSVCCKAGCVPKETIGIQEHEKIFIGEFEAMCSPIGQAGLLNEEKTDFNILLGLCVGHDSLFIKYSEAPVTVLVAKDRMLGHNAAAALNTSTYFARLFRKGF
jgi:uncharacterized metal-binding protein